MKVTPARPAVVPKTLDKALGILKSGEIIAEVAAKIPDVDGVARHAVHEALQLSFFVYDPLDHLAQKLDHVGFTNIEKIDIRKTGTQGLCCIKGDTAYVVFRGSASPLDWFFDFLCLPFYWPLCHLGFGTAWWSAKRKTRAWLEKLPAGVDGVILCGHSLGGGIAHMAALDLAPDFKIQSVVTFGAPKACWLGTADRYNRTEIKGRAKTETLGRATFAVVNQRDIVSKVPFAFLGFRDVGRLIYIDQSSKVHYGDSADMARFNDSMTDIDFLFNFMEEEKSGALGANSNSTQKFYYIFRKCMVWLGRAAPPLKIIILPTMTYVLFSMYFMRSGLAHLGDKYIDVLMDSPPEWTYDRYEKTPFEKRKSFIIKMVLGGLLVAVFLWGLYHISVWTMENINRN